MEPFGTTIPRLIGKNLTNMLVEEYERYRVTTDAVSELSRLQVVSVLGSRAGAGIGGHAAQPVFQLNLGTAARQAAAAGRLATQHGVFSKERVAVYGEPRNVSRRPGLTLWPHKSLRVSMFATNLDPHPTRYQFLAAPLSARYRVCASRRACIHSAHGASASLRAPLFRC